jgi:bis(5'-nucleosidyl)-tetraphosphatase
MEKSCGAVVYTKNKERLLYLILKSVAHNHWSFPKGHVEGTETEQETAIREITEETGLEVLLNDFFRQEIYYSPKPRVKKTVVYFIGEAKHQHVMLQVEEIAHYQWLSYEEALAQITFENEKAILMTAHSYLKQLHASI